MLSVDFYLKYQNLPDMCTEMLKSLIRHIACFVMSVNKYLSAEKKTVVFLTLQLTTPVTVTIV